MKARGDYSAFMDECFTFWGAVDSASFYGQPTCDCATVDPDRHQESCLIEGPGWEVARAAGCLATVSTRLRCHRDTMAGIPFCDFHMERVERWLIDRLDTHINKLVRNRIAEKKSVFMRDDLDDATLQDARAMVAKSKSQVYFLGINDEIVKIGFSINPVARAASIRQGSSICPEGYDRKQAELIGSIPGGQALEAKLHSVLRPHRIDGEWFHVHDDVRSVIEFLLTGDGEDAANTVFYDAAVRPWWISEGFQTEAEAIAS